MATITNPETLIGQTAYDNDGDKIGKVGQVYVDQDNGQPKWLTVNTGLFGSNESFVPLERVTQSGDDVRIDIDKATIKDAPNVDADGAISPEEEDNLYTYYGLGTDTTGTNDYTGTDTPGTETTGTGYTESAGHDTSGPNTDDAMTRSEEQLHVGTERREAGTARLRKYVVTEQQTATVPVSHEEVRVTREPITNANAGDALDGPEISEEEHEVTLHEERPVVEKETVPVERVALGTETVTENEQVSADVRKEEIEYDDGTARTTAGTDETRR
jgi:uncharacterized protein (TIGR02271 family)